MRRGDRGLSLVSLANAVGSRFGEQQRLVAGDALKLTQVTAQIVFAVQIHVERADVEKRQIQELGRRKVHIREQRVRRFGFGILVEVAQKVFDAPAAMPADDGGGDLVADGAR